MRKRIYNVDELNPDSIEHKVTLSFDYDDSRTDQGFYQPIDKTVQGFIATGRNVLALRQPVEDYDYKEGDNIDAQVTGENTPFRDIYPPDIADVSQAIHDNDYVIGKSKKAIDEKIELDSTREAMRKEAEGNNGDSSHFSE